MRLFAVLEVEIFLATWNSKNYPQSQLSYYIFAPPPKIVICSSAYDNALKLASTVHGSGTFPLITLWPMR